MSKKSVPAKKKISQDDLRRIMSEQKLKLSQVAKKIESPLAKYSAKGELTCIVCDSVLRSESVWTVHLNSKQHRENLAKLKRKRDNEGPQSIQPTRFPVHAEKRPGPNVTPIPAKKPKGILKNAPSTSPAVPADFFENSGSGAMKERNVRSDTPVDGTEQCIVNVENDKGSEGDQENDSGDKTPKKESQLPVQEENLPEGFFDDPLLDAKARHVEYKDPIEEEWEKFQKEIKEETTVSAQIISEDQEEATAERQIDEIDEQMRNWSRVLDLERKKEEVVHVTSNRGNGKDDDELSSADEAEFEEYLDWRSKKSYK